MNEPEAFPVVAFDIETPSLDGEAIYVSWCDGGKPQGERLTKPHDFTDWFIDTLLVKDYDRHILAAHFGMKFDFLRLRWELIARSKFKGMFFAAKSLNNIRGINLRRGRSAWYLRDSFNYFPGTLAEFTKTFCPPHLRKMVKYETRIGVNGEIYKAEIPVIDFEKEKFNPHNPDHIAYAKRDSLSLWHAIKGYDATMREHFDVSVFDAVTVPGLAMKCIKKMSVADGYSKPELLPEMFEGAVRSSYHGGLTCAFKTGTFTDVAYFDIRSAYAKIMRDHPFPTGGPVLTFNRPRTKDCLVFATVHIGDEFPFLVSRGTIDDGKDHSKELEPHKARFKGTVCGWFWEFELEVQEKLGSAVKRWAWQVFSGKDDRHRAFIQTCQRFRDLDYKGPLGILAKLFQNSGGYGKYGSEPMMDEIRLSIERPEGVSSPAQTDDGRDIEGLWIKTKQRRQWTLVHWASFITARCRVMLMEYLMRVPPSEWVYSDTDSFIVPMKYVPLFKDDIGPDYGQLKLEYLITASEPFKEIDIRAPKTYRIRKGSGRGSVYKAKGLPMKKIATTWRKGHVMFDAGRSLGVVLRGKFKKGERYRHEVKRTLSNPYSVAHGRYIKGVWTADPIGDRFIPAPELLEPILASIKKALK